MWFSGRATKARPDVFYPAEDYSSHPCLVYWIAHLRVNRFLLASSRASARSQARAEGPALSHFRTTPERPPSLL